MAGLRGCMMMQKTQLQRKKEPAKQKSAKLREKKNDERKNVVSEHGKRNNKNKSNGVELLKGNKRKLIKKLNLLSFFFAFFLFSFFFILLLCWFFFSILFNQTQLNISCFFFANIKTSTPLPRCRKGKEKCICT